MKNGSTISATLLAAACVATASGSVLYDTTGMGPAGSYVNGNGSAIGGAGFLGADEDLQVGDDFTVGGGGFSVTSVGGEWLTFSGGTPTGGALVEIFPKIGGVPSETPIYQNYVSQGDLSGSNFTDTVFGFYVGVALDINLATPANLSPGDYYLSMQPIAMGGDWGFQIIGAAVNSGTEQYLRDGGVDHGNGLPGGYGTNDWKSINDPSFGGAYGPAGDASMRISGDAIPAPGAAALLGLGGLIAGRRRRS